MNPAEKDITRKIDEGNGRWMGVDDSRGEGLPYDGASISSLPPGLEPAESDGISDAVAGIEASESYALYSGDLSIDDTADLVIAALHGNPTGGQCYVFHESPHVTIQVELSSPKPDKSRKSTLIKVPFSEGSSEAIRLHIEKSGFLNEDYLLNIEGCPFAVYISKPFRQALGKISNAPELIAFMKELAGKDEKNSMATGNQIAAWIENLPGMKLHLDKFFSSMPALD